MHNSLLEKRMVKLPRGGELEVQLTSAISERIRQHFGLTGDQAIEDDHVRIFFWGVVNKAIDGAESEVRDGGRREINS
jgi:hypothetical protein